MPDFCLICGKEDGRYLGVSNVCALEMAFVQCEHICTYIFMCGCEHVLRLPKKFEINCKKLESTICNLKLILPNKSLTCVSLQ